jgi:hypothetical protein
MKEIKFRAWYPGVKKMIHFDSPEIACDACNKWGIFFNSVEKNVYMGKCEPMQFIGMKDVFGKEIYDGDILKWLINGTEVVGEVFYDDDWACFWMKNKVRNLICNDFGRGEYIVIGNIYENPELTEARPAPKSAPEDIADSAKTSANRQIMPLNACANCDYLNSEHFTCLACKGGSNWEARSTA